jgi:hypothetical protein
VTSLCGLQLAGAAAAHCFFGRLGLEVFVGSIQASQ